MAESIAKRMGRKGLKKYMAFHQYIVDKHKNYQYAKFKPGHVFDIRVDDISFKLTFMDYELGRNIIQRIEGRREPETIAAVRALAKKGGKVLTIGCCYGYFTNIISQCVGDDGSVVSIEGTPSFYKVLRKNVELNQLRNVRDYNFFITAKADEVYFRPDEKHPYDLIKRLDEQQNLPEPNSTPVRAGKLSTFLEGIEFSPDCIFMDIEGFEVDVFDDFAEGYLKRHRPTIVFEIHDMYYKQPRDLKFIKNILDQHDYYYRKVAGNLLCFPE